MHSHDHAPIAVPDGAPGYYEVMETALRELLVEKGLIKAAEIRR
jgi:nitrile hydratase